MVMPYVPLLYIISSLLAKIVVIWYTVLVNKEN